MGAIGIIIMYFGILALAAYGWFLNLSALLHLEPFVWTAKSVIGLIGVPFAPVGIIMGYLVW